MPGEIHEFKQDLNSLDRSKKKDAVKRIIASMTVGKDVSSLFPGAPVVVLACLCAAGWGTALHTGAGKHRLA